MDHFEMKTEGTLALSLSAPERKLIDGMPLLSEGIAAAIQQASPKTAQLSVVQLDDLADALSAKANHTKGRMLQRRLDTLVRKIDRLTRSHLIALIETKAPPADSPKSMRNRPTLAVTLTSKQRETLTNVCPRKSIQQRLHGDGLQTIQFTHREAEYLHDQARVRVPSASTLQKKRLLSVCNKIGKILGEAPLLRTLSR